MYTKYYGLKKAIKIQEISLLTKLTPIIQLYSAQIFFAYKVTITVHQDIKILIAF